MSEGIWELWFKEGAARNLYWLYHPIVGKSVFFRVEIIRPLLKREILEKATEFKFYNRFKLTQYGATVLAISKSERGR